MEKPIENKYLLELMKFIGKTITVTDSEGKKHNGICRGIQLPHLNIALMTNDEKMIFKQISSIRRKREKGVDKK